MADIDWQPSPLPYPDGKYSCRILIRQRAEGMWIDGGFLRPPLHYEHDSEQEAELCAREQIAKLREKRDSP